MKVIVYTANCGHYDPPRTDILCFTDGHYGEFCDQRRNSRIFKILPHLWLPADTDWSIYLDANLYLKVPPEKLIEEVYPFSWGVFRHNFRDVLNGFGTGRQEGELQACLRLGKEDPDILKAQISHYRSLGFDVGAPNLVMCGIQIRAHCPETKRLCEHWWAEYCRWGCRDQLSFPFAVGSDSNVKHLPAATRQYESPWFCRKGHGGKHATYSA